jgi:hypothetical protein
LNPSPASGRRHRAQRRLVVVPNGQERRARSSAAAAGGTLGLRERGRQVDAEAITSPVERISGPSTGSLPGEARERQHRRLHRDLLRRPLGGQPEFTQLRSRGQAARGLDEPQPVAFDANGTVREARGFASST